MKIKNTMMVLATLTALVATGCGHTSPDVPKPGNGTKENPYLISSKEDLIALQETANDSSYNGFVNDSSKAPFYKLTKDIDLGGMEWTPIGDGAVPFTANIDGAGHVISNYKITKLKLSKSSIGLFGTFHGSIKNLKVADFDITLNPAVVANNIFVGGLVGLAINSNFDNIDIKGAIEVNYNKENMNFTIGGAIGYQSSEVYEENGSYKLDVSRTRFVTTDVEISSNIAGSFIGGITGYVTTNSGNGIANLSYLVSKGSITAPDYVGGITGYMDKVSTISFAYTQSELVGGVHVGGIAAMAASDSAITNSFVASKNIMTTQETDDHLYGGGVVAGLFSPEHDPKQGSKSTLVKDVYKSNLTKLTLNGQVKADEFNFPVAAQSDLFSGTFLNEKMGFTANEWEFGESYPTLKDSSTLDVFEEATINFVSNQPDVTKESFTGLKYVYSTFKDNTSKPNYTFTGWYYDKELKYDYRSYLPTFGNITLYGGWEKNSDLVGETGLFVSSNSSHAGIFKFENDGTLTAYYGDYTKEVMSYKYYGNYITFGSDKSYRWQNTYASYDKDLEMLVFEDNNASTTEFGYVRANEYIGFYRNGLTSIDFLTNTNGTITLVKNGELVTIEFSYNVQNGKVRVYSQDGKLKSIVKEPDGSITFVHDGVAYTNNKNIGFDQSYEDDKSAFIGKTYYGPEFNENYGIKDVTFNKDGSTIYRHSYYSINDSQNNLTLNSNETSLVTDVYVANKVLSYEASSDLPAHDDHYTYTIKEDKDGFYSLTESIYSKLEDGRVVKYPEEIKIKTLEKQIADANTILFNGSYYDGIRKTTFYYEIKIDLKRKTADIDIVKSYLTTGSFYYNGNTVATRGSTGEASVMNAVLNYNVSGDYFVVHQKYGIKDPINPEQVEVVEGYFMLAPYKILGAFAINGVEELKGTVYAYEGHTYYLDELGNVSEVTVESGKFANNTKVTLNIKGNSYQFNVENLYMKNNLTLVK